MQLKRLLIERASWGANKGRYECEIQYENSQGVNVTMPLSESVSSRLLEIVADELVAASKEASATFTAELLEPSNLIEDQS